MDFAEIKRRIADAEARAGASRLGSPEQLAELRRARAAKYAAPADQRRLRRAALARTFLKAFVGPEKLALAADDVVAIVPRAGTHGLPLAPPHVPFMAAFRGEALLVVALHVLQGRPVPEPAPAQRLVVVRWRSGRCALLVDEALGLASGERESLAPARDGAWLPPGTVEGVLPDGASLIDLEALAAGLSGSTSTEGSRRS